MIFNIARRLLSSLYIFINYWNFKDIGNNCRIFSPLKIQGKEFITLGSNVVIEYKSWLAAHHLSSSTKPSLIIGNGSRIGHFAHIYATKSITIGENVLIADKVYIADNTHQFSDVNLPIISQPILQLKTVSIGNDTWIGESVSIIGSNIGKHCVIGANSTVTKDIPDYSVAVGSPAKIIKTYDVNASLWIRVN